MNNSPVTVNEESYIFFSIGAYNYAFNSKYVLDIMQLVELEYPESLPDFIVGLLEYNNRIIKIVDIRTILKLSTEPYTLNAKIIIVKTENDFFGIIIDNVREIRRINTSLLNLPPYQTKNSYLEAIYTDKDTSTTVINLENIEASINSREEFQETSKNSASLFLPRDVSSKETLHRRRLHYARKMRQENYAIIKSQDTYIKFMLNNNICCIKILGVVGFYKFESVKVTKVPCTPDFIVGIVSLKGRYITVIDLLKYTENKHSVITKDTSIIVVEHEDYQLGILADSICETMDIEENLLKSKSQNSTSCLDECVINDTLYMFLDTKKLFEDEKLYVS